MNRTSALAGPEASLATDTRTLIAPGRGAGVEARELWRYRELLYFLIWRDVKVRYKQSVLGVLWAVIQPVLAMLILTVFFGMLARIPSEGVPYPLFVFSALVPWQLFASALERAGGSLVANERLVTKVYFPRLLIPLASVLAGLVDFTISLLVLLGLALWYGVRPGPSLLTLPVFTALAIACAAAVGFWLSALTVRFRDFNYLASFLRQFWLYATPVVYSSSLVPERLRHLLGLNPMAGVVEGFRWALLGRGGATAGELLVSAVVVLILLVTGIRYFRRTESTFADYV